MHPGQLKIEDYTYELPDARIARYPLPERDASKLLLYRNGIIESRPFATLPDALPEDSLLVFNRTKVVNARLLFKKPTGGVIEVFCLEPGSQYVDITTAMAQKGKVLWHCLVGGAGKWKHGMVLELPVPDAFFVLFAKIQERTATDFVIELSWDNPALTFAEVLKYAGKIPLPPYLHREAEESDISRYQTLFAEEEGSVAAPTASLHFTPKVMAALSEKNIQQAMLTLHVGAGTFMPVKSEIIGEHQMHEEWIEVTRQTIEMLLAKKDGPVIAVGTTAMRTIESLYWMGIKAINDTSARLSDLNVRQWDPYENNDRVSKEDALNALLHLLDKETKTRIISRTQILIAPGYHFRIANGLITNFHQPQSTLLLLVAALIGDDWKKVYDYALKNDFRFLSYGDSSLLWANA